MMDKVGPYYSAPAIDVEPVTQKKMPGMWNPANPMGQKGFIPAVSTTDPYIWYPDIMQTTKVTVKVPGQLYMTPSPYPITMTCPHCQQNIVTRVRPIKGCATHLAAAGLCIIGCIVCFYIPYFCGTFKDKEHRCPECRKFIGVYKRI